MPYIIKPVESHSIVVFQRHVLPDRSYGQPIDEQDIPLITRSIVVECGWPWAAPDREGHTKSHALVPL